MKWLKYPFLAITPFLVLGILSGEHLKNEISPWLIALLSGIIFLIPFISKFFRPRQKFMDFLSGTVLFTGFILLGYCDITLHSTFNKPLFDKGAITEISHMTITINSGPEETALFNRYIVSVDEVKFNNHWIKAHEKTLLYIRKGDDKRNKTFCSGDRLLVRGNPAFVEKNGNPHTFDYAKYLGRLGIFTQMFTASGDYLYMGKNRHFSISRIFSRTGNYLETILEKHIDKERDLNLAKAMLLGRRNEITPEMENIYSITGTAHILAVSGLHVGIIFLLLTRIFRFLKRPRTRSLYYMIQITGIWAFAMMTGMSPPVQRASIMFSFIILAGWSGRNSNIFNTLFAAAFFILLLSPNLLFSVSFQLSFMAVLGIAYLYKKIYTLIFIENRILNFSWQITALSLAVQITIFPVTIFYFHRFPLLFPVTNLIAIPTATVVIFSGILLFIISPFESLAYLPGQLLEGWINIYHKIIAWLGGLPFASLDDLYLKTHEVFFILASVFLLVRFVESKQFTIFKILTTVLVVFAIIRVADHLHMSRQEQLFIYKTNNDMSTDLFFGRHCYTNDLSTGKRAQYTFDPNRKYRRIRRVSLFDDISVTRSFGKNTLIVIGGKTIVLWQEPFLAKTGLPWREVDYLAINRKTLLVFMKKHQKFEAGHLILDGSIRGAALSKATKLIENDVKSIYTIHENGAFILDN